MLGDETVGAYRLSEPQAGSDAAALICKAHAGDGGYRVTGTKAWITHGGIADFYNLFARLGEGAKGISCFLVPGQTEGLTFGRPEDKMGPHAVPTTSAYYDDAFIPAMNRIGAEGQGLEIALEALDSGRLGIAAVAVGLAQAALAEATAYAHEGSTFGRRIIDHQGPWLPARRHGRCRGHRTCHLPRRCPPPRCWNELLPQCRRSKARRDRGRRPFGAPAEPVLVDEAAENPQP